MATVPQSGLKLRYETLTAEQSLRLIRLCRTQRDEMLTFDMTEHILDDLDGSLTPANFTDLPVYHALSYHWGNPTLTRSIRVNDCELGIHENLWHFLFQLFRESDYSFYWTDAICINQLDDAERSHQVANMDRIYSQAKSVIAWLSHETLHAQCLEMLAAPSLETRMIAGKTYMRDDALRKVQLLEYWHRAWIVQEISLAADIVLKSIGVTLPLNRFAALCDEEFGDNNVVSSNARHCITMLKIIEDYQGDRQVAPDLMQWLYKLTDLRCRNRRDYVYSLLGLARQNYKHLHGRWPMLQVDYTKSVNTVLMDCFIMNFLFMAHSPLHLNPREETVVHIVQLIQVDFAKKPAKQYHYKVDLIERLLQYLDDQKVQAGYKYIAIHMIAMLLISTSLEHYLFDYISHTVSFEINSQPLSGKSYLYPVQDFLGSSIMRDCQLCNYLRFCIMGHFNKTFPLARFQCWSCRGPRLSDDTSLYLQDVRCAICPSSWNILSDDKAWSGRSYRLDIDSFVREMIQRKCLNLEELRSPIIMRVGTEARRNGFREMLQYEVSLLVSEQDIGCRIMYDLTKSALFEKQVEYQMEQWLEEQRAAIARLVPIQPGR